ncbi:MAG: hypothetical protein ACFB2W_08915 [Leptolyngbyaceae cyanobacterium]
MQQSRLNAYINLIQELLTCPGGEEWIRLKKHEDLADAELVQVMEQIASQLFQEGNRQAAIFLHNWAAKLHHILVKEKKPTQPDEEGSQAYLSFIQSLLECSEDDKEKLLAKHHNLIGPGLVHKMKQVAQQLRQEGSDDSASYLQNLAAKLNQTWIEAHDFQPSLNKEAINKPLETNVVDPEYAIEETLPKPKSKEIESHPNQENSSSSAYSLTTLSELKEPQQLADAIQEMSEALHQLNHILSTQKIQSPSTNPLWYMDVLERAAKAQWLITTEEIEQLIGVKPKCHGHDNTYQRGTWTFIKVGKLGAQTAWKVTKTQLTNPVLEREPSLDNENIVNHYTTDDSHTSKINPSDSIAKHPPLQTTALSNGSLDNDQIYSLEIPEMEDVWA